jgi:hypothetical protein
MWHFWKKEFYNLVTCSWHHKLKPQSLQLTNLKCCIKAREPFKTLLKPFLNNGVLFVIYYFKKHSKPCIYIWETFCSTLNSRIGELENSWFRFLMSRTDYTFYFCWQAKWMFVEYYKNSDRHCTWYVSTWTLHTDFGLHAQFASQH